MACRGEVWQGPAWSSGAGQCKEAKRRRSGTSVQDRTGIPAIAGYTAKARSARIWQSEAWLGLARSDDAWPGRVRRGGVRFDEVRIK